MYVSIHIKHFIFPKLFHFLYHFCIEIQNEIFKQTFSYWLFRKFTFYLIENSSYKVSNTIRWMNIWDFIYFWFMYFFFLFIFEISLFFLIHKVTQNYWTSNYNNLPASVSPNPGIIGRSHHLQQFCFVHFSANS